MMITNVRSMSFLNFRNLRQGYCSSSETIYRSRAVKRSINPNEIEVLRVVLEVIRSVAEYDEVARIAMCEHPNWNPLCTLIGIKLAYVVVLRFIPTRITILMTSILKIL